MNVGPPLLVHGINASLAMTISVVELRPRDVQFR